MTNNIISPNIRIRYPETFITTDYCIIDDFSYFSAKCKFGFSAHISSGVSIIGGKDSSFSCGDFSSLSTGVKIVCGSDDFINDIACLTPESAGHDIKNHLVAGTVELGNFATVGVNSVILPNVIIPEGTTVGAMSFVKKNTKLEPWSVYCMKNGKLTKVANRNKTNVLKQANLVMERLNLEKRY